MAMKTCLACGELVSETAGCQRCDPTLSVTEQARVAAQKLTASGETGRQISAELRGWRIASAHWRSEEIDSPRRGAAPEREFLHYEELWLGEDGRLYMVCAQRIRDFGWRRWPSGDASMVRPPHLYPPTFSSPVSVTEAELRKRVKEVVERRRHSWRTRDQRMSTVVWAVPDFAAQVATGLSRAQLGDVSAEHYPDPPDYYEAYRGLARVRGDGDVDDGFELLLGVGALVVGCFWLYLTIVQTLKMGPDSLLGWVAAALFSAVLGALVTALLGALAAAAVAAAPLVLAVAAMATSSPTNDVWVNGALGGTAGLLVWCGLKQLPALLASSVTGQQLLQRWRR